jgi:hypothetical protein
LVPQTSVQASGAPEVSNGSKIEENHVQIQTIEEQLAPEKVVETPRTKLICPSCKIIYERGSSCVRCGAALVSQTPPKEKEKSKSSDAGSNLSPSESEVLEAAFGVTFRKGTEESKSPEIEPKPSPSESDGLGDLFLRRVAPDLSEASDRKPGVASKQPSPSGPKGQDVGAPERGKKKGPRVTPTPELSLEEEFLQAQSPEQPVAKKSVGDLLKSGTFLDKLKKDYRRLGLEVGSIVIMVVAGGYLLWSVYSYLAKPKQPEPGAPVSKNAAVQSLPKSSSSTPPTPAAAESGESKKTEGSSSISGSSVSKDAASAPPAPSLPDAAKTRSAESQDKENIKTVFENEIRNIKTLLENVRQSNLKKDIDLFVSCYSSDFENMEGRKRATIAYWEKFNYLDLSYDLKDLSLSAETAKARVEWLIKTSSRNGDQAQQNKSVLDVAFKKEGGKWRIREVKPAK